MAVLFVHPEGCNRDAAIDALRREGFDVRPASNAFRAVSELAGRTADCVVLDLTSLDERDLEVIPVLRELTPGISLILIFPPAKRELAARGLTLGADAYLPEPFYMEELVALVKRATSRLAAPRPASLPEDLLQRLAADAAHEINNPLQIIQLVYDGHGGRTSPGRTKIEPHLGRIAGVSRRLAELGQLPGDEPAPAVDLAGLIEDACTSLPDTTEAVVQPVRPVEGHAEFLGAVIKGLLRRAVHGETPARITCQDCDLGGDPCVEVLVEGGPWQGLERSTTGEDAAKGPLFLTFCRIVALRHGGRIEAREVADEPVGYRLLLPALAPGRDRA